MQTRRMKAGDRRQQILQAVVAVFARKGFCGATTRELAVAAGVSEALLYRHFPSKERLYAAVARYHAETPDQHQDLHRILRMPNGCRRLVALVHYLVQHTIDPGHEVFARLFAQSLLADGACAKLALTAFRREIWRLMRDSVSAARGEGQLESDASDDDMGVWCIHHLALSLQLVALPGGVPVLDYGMGRQQLVQHAVRFALRGLGMKRAAIRRFYDGGDFR